MNLSVKGPICLLVQFLLDETAELLSGLPLACSLTVYSDDGLRDVERVFGDATVLSFVDFFRSQK